ncbi:cupin domain [Kribbella orskensis]|jgi:mannose-6-phosphate isomerase-like protein (cupin superfamily)|uniref:Cupin domain n=1 Tax=Kribbella orskensis TaxID=2512216 RepID=A0ABY2BKZ3_9ACTN|nr:MULTISPECIES: cupin domain-containing protein [Kribbella]TCN40753.1 cupin domain [Kribbella sp. VKM Ac-2500]TCO24005.1 cupin domain [Kribbella orskensis]
MKVITPNDVETHDNETRTSWRLLTPETLGETHGARAALIEYKYRETEPTDDELGGEHDHAEYYYVISGSGVIGLPGKRIPIKEGSAFVVPVGVRHSIWGASSDAPVQAFFVALKP